MNTNISQPFCPNCDQPLNPPEAVTSSCFSGFGHIRDECNRDCGNCGQHLTWSAHGVLEGAWVPAAPRTAPSPVPPAATDDERVPAMGANRTPAKSGAELVPIGPAASVVVRPPTRGDAGMKEQFVSVAAVAASTPWSEAALSELAKAPGSPFHVKAGIWVARESEVHRWLETDDAESDDGLRRPPFQGAAGKRKRPAGKRRQVSRAISEAPEYAAG